MKKVLLSLWIFFMLLTVGGAFYVLSTGGQANAGYAVIPMLFSFAFSIAYRRKK